MIAHGRGRKHNALRFYGQDILTSVQDVRAESLWNLVVYRPWEVPNRWLHALGEACLAAWSWRTAAWTSTSVRATVFRSGSAPVDERGGAP